MIERPTGKPESKRLNLRVTQVESLQPAIITFRISGVQKIFVEEIAELEGLTGSDVMREALDNYFEKKKLEYQRKRGKKKVLANKIEEVVVYSEGLKRALDNLGKTKPSRRGIEQRKDSNS